MKRLGQELDKLAVLLAVAEKGKINEAAEVLHLTQPSVSRAIQKLEEAFGTKIFTRSRDGVKLTKGGELLHASAVKIFHELEDVQARARHVDEDFSGSMSVGTYESLAEYLWPDFLLHLQKQHPHLQLSIKTSLNQDPVSDLLNGKIDMLVDAEAQIRTSLTSWPIYADRFGFFVARDEKLKVLTPQAAQDRAIVFVQKAYDENRIPIEEHLEKAGYSFSRKYCFDSFSTAKRLTAMGMGIGVLPLRLAEQDLMAKLIKPLALEGFPPEGFGKHTIFATVSAEREREPRLKKLIALLKAHFKT